MFVLCIIWKAWHSAELLLLKATHCRIFGVAPTLLAAGLYWVFRLLRKEQAGTTGRDMWL